MSAGTGTQIEKVPWIIESINKSRARYFENGSFYFRVSKLNGWDTFICGSLDLKPFGLVDLHTTPQHQWSKKIVNKNQYRQDWLESWWRPAVKIPSPDLFQLSCAEKVWYDELHVWPPHSLSRSNRFSCFFFKLRDSMLNRARWKYYNITQVAQNLLSHMFFKVYWILRWVCFLQFFALRTPSFAKLHFSFLSLLPSKIRSKSARK